MRRGDGRSVRGRGVRANHAHGPLLARRRDRVRGAEVDPERHLARQAERADRHRGDRGHHANAAPRRRAGGVRVMVAVAVAGGPAGVARHGAPRSARWKSDSEGRGSIARRRGDSRATRTSRIFRGHPATPRGVGRDGDGRRGGCAHAPPRVSQRDRATAASPVRGDPATRHHPGGCVRARARARLSHRGAPGAPAQPRSRRGQDVVPQPTRAG